VMEASVACGGGGVAVPLVEGALLPPQPTKIEVANKIGARKSAEFLVKRIGFTPSLLF